jgi:hypothetical protein
MLINVKIKKKNVFHRTDTRTTQNYSSEPHKNSIFFKFAHFEYPAVIDGIGL